MYSNLYITSSPSPIPTDSELSNELSNKRVLLYNLYLLLDSYSPGTFIKLPNQGNDIKELMELI